VIFIRDTFKLLLSLESSQFVVTITFARKEVQDSIIKDSSII